MHSYTEKLLISVLITLWKTCSVIHKTTGKGVIIGISTGLFTSNLKVFHTFLLKKDINLLILHRKRELWIKLLND